MLFLNCGHDHTKERPNDKHSQEQLEESFLPILRRIIGHKKTKKILESTIRLIEAIHSEWPRCTKKEWPNRIAKEHEGKANQEQTYTRVVCYDEIIPKIRKLNGSHFFFSCWPVHEHQSKCKATE